MDDAIHIVHLSLFLTYQMQMISRRTCSGYCNVDCLMVSGRHADVQQNHKILCVKLLISLDQFVLHALLHYLLWISKEVISGSNSVSSAARCAGAVKSVVTSLQKSRVAIHLSLHPGLLFLSMRCNFLLKR